MSISVRFQELERLGDALSAPDYHYLFLEPLLTWGLGFGIITFLFGLLVAEQKTRIFGLAIIIASALFYNGYMDQRKLADQQIQSSYGVSSPGLANSFSNTTMAWKDRAGFYWTIAAVGIFTVLLGKGLLGKIGAGVTATIAAWAMLSGWQMHHGESVAYDPRSGSGSGGESYVSTQPAASGNPANTYSSNPPVPPW